MTDINYSNLPTFRTMDPDIDYITIYEVWDDELHLHLLVVQLYDEDNQIRRTIAIDKKRNTYRRSRMFDDVNVWEPGPMDGFHMDERIELVRVMDEWCDE